MSTRGRQHIPRSLYQRRLSTASVLLEINYSCTSCASDVGLYNQLPPQDNTQGPETASPTEGPTKGLTEEPSEEPATAPPTKLTDLFDLPSITEGLAAYSAAVRALNHPVVLDVISLLEVDIYDDKDGLSSKSSKLGEKSKGAWLCLSFVLLCMFCF